MVTHMLPTAEARMTAHGAKAQQKRAVSGSSPERAPQIRSLISTPPKTRKPSKNAGSQPTQGDTDRQNIPRNSPISHPRGKWVVLCGGMR